jgi:general secretion pathway protein M
MIATLRDRFDALTDREQRLVLFGSIAAVVLLVLAIVLPVERGVSQSRANVTRKRADLGWIQQMAPALAAAPRATPANAESLIVLIDRSARDAGLGQALTGSQPSGNGAMRTQFEKADFNRLVDWISMLGQQYGVQAESATFEAGSEPGIVDAVVVLRNAG